jgi:hypothetical protein
MRDGKKNWWRPRRDDTTQKTRCGWENNFKTNLREKYGRVWIGLIWLRTGTGGGLL